MRIVKAIYIFLLIILLVGCSSQPNITTNDTHESNSPSTTDDSQDDLPPDPEHLLFVHFIDVGQGDSILIDLEEFEILIDGGGRNSGVADYIDTYVDGTLEVVVATHPDADHIGGLIEVFNSFVIGELWHTGGTKTTQVYGDFQTAFQAEGCQIRTLTRGDTLSFSYLVFEVYHPASLTGSTNNQSIVLYLDYGEVDFLFTGDAEQEAEVSMITAGLLSDIEILKVGHHGSSSSSSIAFLDILKPEIAIYMAGEGNGYGHPHHETLVALASIDAEIYGTDIHGTIVIITDGVDYEVDLEKQTPPITP